MLVSPVFGGWDYRIIPPGFGLLNPEATRPMERFMQETASSFAGTGPTPAPSNTTSVARNADHLNTPNNATDFAAGTPTPSNSATTPEELIEHCRGQLARFKVPKQVTFVDALPRNPSGKVLKRGLRDRT